MTNRQKFVTKAAGIANVVFAGGGGVSLIALGFFVYRHGWRGDSPLYSLTGVVLYYGVPALLAILFFVFLRLGPVHKINALLIGLALAVSLYGLEAFLKVLSDRDARMLRNNLIWDIEGRSKEDKAYTKAYARNFGVDFDTRDRVEVIDDLRKRGVDAVPIVSPSNNLFVKEPDGNLKSAVKISGEEGFPLGAVSNKMTILCNESGQHILYPSDDHGFNNPEGAWRQRQIEVAALGDSFAHGYCVSPDRNFVALIRQRFPDTLNLGMAGNGPLLTLATLKEYLPNFKPGVVLWFYFEGNDLENLETEKKSALLMRYLERGYSQNLVSKQSEIDRALIDFIKVETAKWRSNRRTERPRLSQKLQEFVKLVAIRKRAGWVRPEREAIDFEADFDVNMKLFREILSQSKSLVSSWGGRLWFVYLPEQIEHWDLRKKQRASVLSMVKSLDIPLVDTLPAFQAHSDYKSLFPFRGWGHFNEQGHQEVANEVLKALSVEVSH